MEYTKEQLHGLLYQHRNSNGIRRMIIPSYDDKSDRLTDCAIGDGITSYPWFSVKEANDWIKEGVWILEKEQSQIINNYQIY
jgi:hypothetical protein